MKARLEASKKASYKPYLAKMLIDGKREFAEKFKISNSRRAFQLEVEIGDIIDGRGSVWSGNGSNYVGGYFCALITTEGAVTIDRTTADYILKQKQDGWLATGMWAVDDGINAVRIGNDESLGKTPLPGQGDCGGIILEKDDKIRLVGNLELHIEMGEENFDGHKLYIVPLDGKGFPNCDLAPRLHQLKIWS